MGWGKVLGAVTMLGAGYVAGKNKDRIAKGLAEFGGELKRGFAALQEDFDKAVDEANTFFQDFNDAMDEVARKRAAKEGEGKPPAPPTGGEPASAPDSGSSSN